MRDQRGRRLAVQFGPAPDLDHLHQATQYRVVLEVKPEFRLRPEALKESGGFPLGQQVPLDALARITRRRAARHSTHRPVPGGHRVLQPGARGRARRRRGRVQRVEREIGLPAAVQTGFQGAAASFRDSLDANAACWCWRRWCDVHRLGVLYESTITRSHPVDAATATVGALAAL